VPTPRTTAPPPPPATQPPPPPPTAAPNPPSPPAQEVVHPGAFCSPVGATGVTVDGTPMICSDHSATGKPYTQPRWRAA
jgi:hypothetical protein